MITGSCARMEEAVRPNGDGPYFHISIFVMGPEGTVVDNFTARRVIDCYKEILDADYEEDEFRKE